MLNDCFVLCDQCTQGVEQNAYFSQIMELCVCEWGVGGSRLVRYLHYAVSKLFVRARARVRACVRACVCVCVCVCAAHARAHRERERPSSLAKQNIRPSLSIRLALRIYTRICPTSADPDR